MSYSDEVLAKIWGIVKPTPESEYDTNNLYDLIRDGVKAKEDLANERERCAQIATAYSNFCERAASLSGDVVLISKVKAKSIAAQHIAEKIRSGE